MDGEVAGRAAALQRWAAAHAASVRPGRPGPAARPDQATAPAPSVVASVTESPPLTFESDALGVSACVTGEGKVLLAVGERDGSVNICDAETGHVRHRLPGHTEPVYTVDWGRLPDGRLVLASGADDGAVRIWGAEAGDLIRLLSWGDTSSQTHVVSWGYQRDGAPLLAICRSDGMRIWDPSDSEVRVLRLPQPGDSSWRAYATVCWSHAADGALLLIAGHDDGTVTTWDATNWSPLRTFNSHGRMVRAVTRVVHPGGTSALATVEYPSSGLTLWTEAGDGALTGDSRDLGHGPLINAAWIPLDDGRLLLAGSTEHSAFLLDGHTLDELFAAPVSYSGLGLRHLGWTVLPDGRLLLCVASEQRQVRRWTITLDPPIRPAADLPPPPRRRAKRPGSPPGMIIDPPEDITPALTGDPGRGVTSVVSSILRPDGHVLVATSTDSSGPVRIWDATEGRLLHVLTGPSDSYTPTAWTRRPDGEVVLATAARAGQTVQLWDAASGELTAELQHPDGQIGDVGWIPYPDGRILLAVGAKEGGDVQILDPDSGDLVHRLHGDGAFATPMGVGQLASGRPCLVTCAQFRPGRMWDCATGELVREFVMPDSNSSSAWAAAWGHGPGGRPELALACTDGAIRIWDPETGELLRTLTGHEGPAWSVAWLDRPGLPALLASNGRDQVVRLWDPQAGTELYQIANGAGTTRTVNFIQDRDGGLLVVADPEPRDGSAKRPFGIWRVALGGQQPEQDDPGDPFAVTSAGRAGQLASWLLRLGRGGLWPPLGLVADLVTLTGPAGPGGRLAALDSEPGITGLRGLGWPPAARVAFAALLTGSLDIPAAYRPPAGDTAANGTLAGPADPRPLGEALRAALTGETGAGGPAWQAPLDELRTAAAAAEKALGLLRLLGPDACASDPLLPLRLAHSASRLPALSAHQVSLLSSGARHRPTANQGAAGTLSYSPGTAGLARNGPLSRLLPTQLALPRDLLAARLAQDQLLYRQHRGPAPPAPQPVTIILDTTPPTYGPAGNTLRLAAHLITRTLWEHGRHPALVTLTDPETVAELRSPADLLRIWTSATLDDPVGALPVARLTAAAFGQPAVCCTHFHTARDCCQPGPVTRLLTTHQPPEPAPRPPSSRWHAHLPPAPTRAELDQAVARLLVPAASGRNGGPG